MGNYAIESYWPQDWLCDLSQASQNLLLGTSSEMNPRERTTKHVGNKDEKTQARDRPVAIQLRETSYEILKVTFIKRCVRGNIQSASSL